MDGDEQHQREHVEFRRRIEAAEARNRNLNERVLYLENQLRLILREREAEVAA